MQNNLPELWSMVDFIKRGYLGVSFDILLLTIEFANLRVASNWIQRHACATDQGGHIYQLIISWAQDIIQMCRLSQGTDWRFYSTPHKNGCSHQHAAEKRTSHFLQAHRGATYRIHRFSRERGYAGDSRWKREDLPRNRRVEEDLQSSWPSRQSSTSRGMFSSFSRKKVHANLLEFTEPGVPLWWTQQVGKDGDFVNVVKLAVPFSFESRPQVCA